MTERPNRTAVVPRRSSRNRRVRELKIATARLHRRQERDGQFRAIRVPAKICVETARLRPRGRKRVGKVWRSGPALPSRNTAAMAAASAPTEPPMIRNDVAITPELVKEHGLKPDEYQRFLDLIGREPTLTELGIFSAMWNEHCSYKSSRLHLRDAADQGAVGDPGAGRERRRHRHRRRARLRLQDGEPQPPLLHRALPGRDDRRRRHPARRLHHGRAADRLR